MTQQSFYDEETAAMISDMGGEFPENAGTAQFDENYEFDTSDTDETSLATGGFVDKEGNYHFEVEKVDLNLTLIDDDGKQQTPHVRVTCIVLESVRNQSPAGSRLMHRIYVAQKDGSPAKQGSIDSMNRFCLGIGVMKWAEIKGEKKLVSVAHGTTKFKLAEIRNAINHQFCASVRREPSKDEKYADKYSIPMGRAYHPMHPECAGWQKNMEALEAAGYVERGTAAKQAAAQNATPVNQKQAAAQAAGLTSGNGGQSAGQSSGQTQTAAAAATSSPAPAVVPSGNEDSGGESWDIDSL